MIEQQQQWKNNINLLNENDLRCMLLRKMSDGFIRLYKL